MNAVVFAARRLDVVCKVSAPARRLDVVCEVSAPARRLDVVCEVSAPARRLDVVCKVSAPARRLDVVCKVSGPVGAWMCERPPRRLDVVCEVSAPARRLDVVCKVSAPARRLDVVCKVSAPARRLDVVCKVSAPGRRLDVACEVSAPARRLDVVCEVSATARRLDVVCEVSAPARCLDVVCKTFKANYQFLHDDMTKLNEGLAKRQEMRRLKKARQDLCATIGNLPATGNADRIRRMQQEMGDLDQRIHAMYVDMVAQDQCIYVEGHGFFFAEFWLAPDLKALKGMLGIPQSGRAPHPCPHCDVKRDEIHDITKTWGERTDHQKVLPIPMSHVRPCGMHLIHRVNEKLTQLLTKLVWSSENKDEWDEHMEANHLRLLNFFNDELKLNGGHCKIEIKEKEGKVYPGKIPMNGPECKRFIDRWAEAVGMIWYLPEETIQKLLSIGKKWARCMEYITKPFYNDYAPEEEEYEEEGALDERELRDQRIRMEGNDRVNAHEAFRAFVEAYADYAGSGVTHYMHIMYYHPSEAQAVFAMRPRASEAHAVFAMRPGASEAQAVFAMRPRASEARVVFAMRPGASEAHAVFAMRPGASEARVVFAMRPGASEAHAVFAMRPGASEARAVFAMRPGALEA
ncbi:hypothetical protein CYMTET_39451 [Cymbomonas tetramitiformis]|uniref:Uncharacterized protein n=1 Tax=Cymbomonas tetramitiformis TaxID=36881 RepID=A0AAE0F4G6_9CHLO|nr:hypothetical protein CYMTET_39451 [Cymbomonas tetramitiformis]